jgi:hypothetical protein
MTRRPSCYDRILYGADAAEFLPEMQVLLEAPMTIAR